MIEELPLLEQFHLKVGVVEDKLDLILYILDKKNEIAIRDSTDELHERVIEQG